MRKKISRNILIIVLLVIIVFSMVRSSFADGMNQLDQVILQVF